MIQEEQDGTGFGAGGGGGGGSPSAAPAASAPSSTSSGVDTTPLPMPTPVGTPIAHTLVGKMQIIYLPDLDEQYVIKSKNWLAKSAFALTFNDDNSLQAVTGNHDATTVTVSLLQQVDKAISAAQGVLGARCRDSRRQPRAPAPPRPASGGLAPAEPVSTTSSSSGSTSSRVSTV